MLLRAARRLASTTAGGCGGRRLLSWQGGGVLPACAAAAGPHQQCEGPLAAGTAAFVKHYCSGFEQPAAAPSQHRPWKPYSSFGLAAAREPVPEFDVYRVTVVTGHTRGAGTKYAAWIQLFGTHGESDKFLIADSDENGLPKGSSKTFEMLVPRDIGSLRRVYVERDKGSSCDIADGWFLDSVRVEGPEEQLRLFPCHSWLGQSECGGITGTTSGMVHLRVCQVIVQGCFLFQVFASHVCNLECGNCSPIWLHVWAQGYEELKLRLCRCFGVLI